MIIPVATTDEDIEEYTEYTKQDDSCQWLRNWGGNITRPGDVWQQQD